MKECNKNRADMLGERMKSYEALTTNMVLMPNAPVYARIDGRAFHTLTRGLNKPFDTILNTLMQITCYKMVKETNAILGYVQSDEISLGWENFTKAPFNGKLFKLESVLASMATAIFYMAINNFVCRIGDSDVPLKIEEKDMNSLKILVDKSFSKPISFDCRIFNVPDMEELANAFLWRENDAVKNSISSLAQAHFSHKRLQGLNSNEMQNLLLTEKGINWNDLPDIFKRGTYLQRELVQFYIPDEIWDKIPDKNKPTDRTCTRSEINVLNLPIMKKVENKVGVYFYREEPIFKVSK